MRGKVGSEREFPTSDTFAKSRQNSASSRSWFLYRDSTREGPPFKDPGAIWTMNVVIIWKKSRSLARSGTKRRQNARVNATFSRSYVFSYSKSTKINKKRILEHWLHLLASTLFNQVSIALRRISDQCDADDGWVVGLLRRRRKKKKKKKKKKSPILYITTPDQPASAAVTGHWCHRDQHRRKCQ